MIQLNSFLSLGAISNIMTLMIKAMRHYILFLHMEFWIVKHSTAVTCS